VARDFYLLQRSLDRLPVSFSLFFDGHSGYFAGIKRPLRYVDLSLQSSTEVNSDGKNNSAQLICRHGGNRDSQISLLL